MDRQAGQRFLFRLHPELAGRSGDRPDPHARPPGIYEDLVYAQILTLSPEVAVGGAHFRSERFARSRLPMPSSGVARLTARMARVQLEEPTSFNNLRQSLVCDTCDVGPTCISGRAATDASGLGMHELLGFSDHSGGADEKGGALVQGRRCQLEDSVLTIGCFPTCLLDDERKGIAFVEETQFSFW